MDNFEFSENAAFYRVREGKNIATIINNYINTKTEEVVDACYVSHTNKRNPSRHRIEDHDMLNWLKANRKRMNAGELKPERAEKFKKLLEMTEQYKRKNQYK